MTLKTALLALVLAGALHADTIQVDIFENQAAGKEFEPAGEPSTTYTEPAFAFVRISVKYSDNALPLDRSTPYVLRATLERAFPAGERRFRLRARGAAVLRIDGKVVAQTKPQPPNTSGDDPVPPPVVRDHTPLRPPAYPHQDVFATLTLDGQPHRFELVAIIGGKGLMPTPGELAVSHSGAGALDRLLGADDAPLLTDAAWESYVAASDRRHSAADRERRRAQSKGVVAAWEARHRKILEWLKSKPAPQPPAIAATTPAFNDIDRFLGPRLEAAKVAPRPLTGDLDFLRRLSIDAIGTIPTEEEIRKFLADPPAERRARAIERLLAHPSWADNWVSYWQDVLAENPGILKPDLNNTGPFRLWLHQSFTDNLPFDRMVAELVQMEGSKHQGAPAAFSQATLNDAPMAAKADILAQAFLGQRLGCARCHDAPFHPFTQKDLFSLAAMLNGKPLALPSTSTVPLVEGGRKPAVKIALKPGEAIEPEWPFRDLAAHNDTGTLPSAGSVPTRNALASLIISPDNQRFAQVIANRVWKRYLGAGIVEPADDWSRARPSHPELLDYLAREFVAGGYDLRNLARLIFSSHAYQRQPVTATAEQGSAKTRLFAGPLRRRMTAEQMVDSLHLVAGKTLDCEELNLNPAGDRPPAQFLNMGRPERAWQMTALSNERDRPALALPVAQSVVDVMTTYGWRQSRQNAVTTRDDAPSPMQTLILANGVLGTRIVRLSDDSAFTEMALRSATVDELIQRTFLRVPTRLPTPEEARPFADLLQPVHANRVVAGAELVTSNARKTDSRVSWSNHLSAEATLIRMEEEKRLRMGDEPTRRLTKAFRERYEDALWAMLNSPEFVLMP